MLRDTMDETAPHIPYMVNIYVLTRVFLEDNDLGSVTSGSLDTVAF